MKIKEALKATSFYLKKYGLLRTIKKIMYALYNKVFNKKNIYSREEKYYQWIQNNEPNKEQLEKQKNEKFDYEPKFSIIVPMYNTPSNYFKELVDSLTNQTYNNWELCLADGSAKQNEQLKPIIENDNRIKYKFLNENKGIAENTNAALEMATGDYIALLDHDDVLQVFCLYELVKEINRNKDVEFIYTDEDKIGENNKRFDPHFKPDFSIDTLRSNNYITHLSVFKKELMQKLGGFRNKYDGAQDFDIIIRATEQTDKILHIPKILYHWRVHQNSTAMVSDSKPYAYEAGKRVIEDHLERQHLQAEVSLDKELKGVYEVEYKVEKDPNVSILIPNKDSVKLLKKCVNSILNLTTYKNYEIVIIENNSEKNETFKYYEELKENEKIRILQYPEKGFNYSKIINYGVKNCESDFILQLNSDTQVLTPNWLEKFIGFAQRKDVGAVGARLYYKDKSIQHAGIGIGICDLSANLFVCTPKDMHAYFAREAVIRNVSAVTGACLFARREMYEEVRFYGRKRICCSIQ